MDYFDSESLTPPGSPVLGYSGLRGNNELDKSSTTTSTGAPVPVYCFNCKGPLRAHDKSFNSDGFFLRNQVISAIKRLNSNNPQNVSFDDSFGGNNSAIFFGHRFDLKDMNQMKILVRMCRKNLYALEAMVAAAAVPSFSAAFGLPGVNFPGGRNIQNEDEIRSSAFKLRWDVCQFLNYLAAGHVKLTLNEVQELFGGLRKSLERPEFWSSSMQFHCGSKDGNECSSAEYHLFHLQLEFRWCFILIFELSQPILTWVLEGLLYLTHIKFKGSERNLLEKNPFNCYCIKELWAMIRAVVYQLKPNGREFWDYVTSLLTKLDIDKDSIFPLWLISNLVTLNDYSMNGIYNPISIDNQRDKLQDSTTCYTLINQVLKDWVDRGGKTFEVNELVSNLLPYWGFDLDVALTLWNIWLPRIDKGSEVRNVDPYSSVGKWMTLVTSIVTSSSESGFDKTENELFLNDHFLAFLRLFCGHVKLSNLKDWRRLKANICNKLPQKTVSGFGENGLIRVATMFLALVLIKDDSDVMGERLIETLSYGKDSLAVLKIRAKCVLILILLQKGINISSISTSIMKTVNELMGMSVSGRTSIHKDLIMVYMDFLDNIPKFNGDLNLGQSDLVSLNLTMWLSTCGHNYVNRTLRVLHKLLDSWILNSSCVLSSEKELIARTIQDKTEQFLKQTVISSQYQNPEFDVQPLADLAVDLTILHGLRKNSSAVSNLYEVFALNSNASPAVSEIYIERTLDSVLSMDLQSLISDNRLTQSWIRLVTLGRTVPQRLSARALCLPEDSISAESKEHEVLLLQFCSNVKEAGCWTPTLLQTMVTPVLDALKVAKTKSSAYDRETVEQIIKSAVILFKNLPFNKIYIRNSQSSFVVHVLEICCPNFVAKPPWEKLPDSFLVALNKYLPDIFITVLSHEQWLQDPYLKRKMCDLVRFALLGFANGEELDSGNAGLCIMQYCEGLNGQNRNLIMQEIATSIQTMGKEEQFTKRFLPTFVAFLNRRMVTTAVFLLGSVLELLIAKNEFPNRCRGIIALTWASVLGKESYSYLKPVLLSIIENTMNNQFAFRSERFFELFSSLAQHTQYRLPIRKFLQEKVMPLLSKQVVLLEAKQASGTNYKLRGLLKKFENELRL